MERWDGFLGQIEARHREVREEAMQRGQALLAGDPSTAALAQMWSAVESRLMDLEARIMDTWHEKVCDAFYAEGIGEAGQTAALERAAALGFALEIGRQRLEQRLQADLARQLFARAQAAWRGCFCGQCGAELAVPLTSRAVHLPCARCGAATLFEPGEPLRLAAAAGAHALAQEAAEPQWLAMREAERQLRESRTPHPLALLKQYERAQIAYWWSYLGGRAQFEPELARDPAGEVRARMDAWYRGHAEFEEEWVRHGRPAERIG
jgi:hypothetical protein